MTILRRFLQNNEFIAEFIQATALHMRRFRNHEAQGVAHILEWLWIWAHNFRTDLLCAEFLRVIRTSALLWGSLFEASSRTTDKHKTETFKSTPHSSVSALASKHVLTRASSDEAKALAELWVSTGVFEAVEVTLGEALRYGTDDELVELSGASSHLISSCPILSF